MQIVVATNNQHKFVEFQSLLSDFPLVSLASLGPAPEPAETVDDYAGNALIKAIAASKRGASVVLADDSGLEVDALDGAPGVLSARYAEGTDEDRCHKLLKALENTDNRRARQVCCLALMRQPFKAAPPGYVQQICGNIVFARGEVRGTITRTPRGSGGFGYDSIFEVDGFGLTMAELEASEKNKISHRAKACSHILSLLRNMK